MRFANADFIPSLFVAAALVGAVSVFISETRSFRDAVAEWARRDLESRTELAAANLREPLETGDFRRIHEFGDVCSDDGVRLTVFSAPGGVVFDSVRDPSAHAPSIYATHTCGEFRVRLGLPADRVFAPYRRARFGFILAAIAGGAGVMLVLLFTVRQRMRMRALAQERDTQRRLVEEMKKVEAFRRDFIADVSHEIKTPLTGIIGAADLLSSGDAPDDMRDRLLEMVKTESERLNALAQGILSLSRLERDGESGVVVRRETDVSGIVRDAVERLRPLAYGKGIEISVDAPPDCVAVCDGSLVESAVTNLVANAIRHSGSKDVSVAVAADGNTVRIAVEDHGVGIPSEERERVFERFHRVDSARSADTGGAGLGLAIVRRIAKLHGGDVVLEPAVPTGCRFVLSVMR